MQTRDCVHARRNKKSSLRPPELAGILPYFRVFGAGMDWWTTSTASQRERKATLMTGTRLDPTRGLDSPSPVPCLRAYDFLKVLDVNHVALTCQRSLPLFCVTDIR